MLLLGWNIETGHDTQETYLKPEMLISLTAPKICSKNFEGKHHILAGRFIPQNLQDKYNLNLPSYHGSCPCVVIQKQQN